MTHNFNYGFPRSHRVSEDTDPRPGINRMVGSAPASAKRRGYIRRLQRYTRLQKKKEKRVKRSRTVTSSFSSSKTTNITHQHSYMRFDDPVDTEYDVTSSEEDIKRKRSIKKFKKVVNSDIDNGNSSDDQGSSSTSSVIEETEDGSNIRTDEVLERIKKEEHYKEVINFFFPKNSNPKPKKTPKKEEDKLKIERLEFSERDIRLSKTVVSSKSTPNMEDKVMIKRLVYSDHDIRLKKTVVTARQRDLILKQEFQL